MSGPKKKRHGKVLTFAVSTALLATAPAMAACGAEQDTGNEPAPTSNEPSEEILVQETVNEPPAEPEPETEPLPERTVEEPAPTMEPAHHTVNEPPPER